MSTTPKLCECGCGQPTPLAKWSTRRLGLVAGQPTHFIMGHHNSKRKELSPKYWTEDPKTGCWLWNGPTNGNGYGKFKGVNAHRAVYEKYVGPIEKGAHLDHLCRVKQCVNPSHMEPVHQVINIRRGPQVKLTQDDVDTIRALYAEGGRTHKSLAEQFNVSDTTIFAIMNYINWKPIALESQESEEV